jgi:hypothetical protein
VYWKSLKIVKETTLYVLDYPAAPKRTMQELKSSAMFGKYGRVLRVQNVNSKKGEDTRNLAVTYEHPLSVAVAIQCLNGKSFNNGKCMLKCSFALGTYCSKFLENGVACRSEECTAVHYIEGKADRTVGNE